MGYAWAGYRDGTPAGDTIRLTRRIHLDPRGATPEQVATVRHQLTGALEQLVNQRHHRLPVLQPDQVTGPPAPGPVLWVGAEFVDSPEAAHTVVRVHPGLPAPGQPMVQNRWFTGVHAAAHAHEFVHGLGVRDDRADPRVLLTPGGRGSQTVTEGQSSLMGPLRDDAGTEPCFTLTSDHLQQITDVLAPYLHQGNHTPTAAGGGQLSANSARVGSDTSPAVDYELIHADDKSSVVESGEGEALYHFTDALPERIFREGLAPMDRSTIVTVERWQANPPPNSSPRPVTRRCGVTRSCTATTSIPCVPSTRSTGRASTSMPPSRSRKRGLASSKKRSPSPDASLRRPSSGSTTTGPTPIPPTTRRS